MIGIYDRQASIIANIMISLWQLAQTCQSRVHNSTQQQYSIGLCTDCTEHTYINAAKASLSQCRKSNEAMLAQTILPFSYDASLSFRTGALAAYSIALMQACQCQVSREFIPAVTATLHCS